MRNLEVKETDVISEMRARNPLDTRRLAELHTLGGRYFMDFFMPDVRQLYDYPLMDLSLDSICKMFAHVALKTWVTPEHLQQAKEQVLQRIGEYIDREIKLGDDSMRAWREYSRFHSEQNDMSIMSFKRSNG